MKKLAENVIIAGPFRMSYMNVFKTRRNEQRKCDEYSTVLLIPKKPTTQCPNPDKVKKEIEAVLEAALVLKFKAVPKKYENCLLDGDVETNNDGDPKHPGYWFISTRADADQPPVLIDSQRKPCMSATEWASGDWANVKLSVFGYEFEGKRGVSTRLKAVQFRFKDEPFGASQDPEAVANEFDEFDEEELV